MADDDVQQAGAVEVTRCECCGQLTIWFFDENGERYASAALTPDEFVELAGDGFDLIGIDDPNEFPAVQGSA